MASPNLIFTVEDLRTPEGTELVLQQFRNAINRIPAQKEFQQKKFSLSDLSPQDIADLAKLIRDQLEAPGAAPLNIEALQGTPAIASGSSSTGGGLLRLYVGTLSPNTKPLLTILNIYQAMFYSTDFDHTYLWNGLAWLVMERTVGAIHWFSVAPATNGWHVCDGTSVTQSTSSGGTGSVTVPDLVTGNPYVRGGAAYSGPTATAAIAPTISGSTGTESAHTHSVTASGSVTGNVPAHAHVLLDSLIDGGGLNMSNAVFLDGTAWFVAGANSGNTGNTDVDHVHYNNGLCGATSTGDTTYDVSNVPAVVTVSAFDHVHTATVYGYTDAVIGGLSHHHSGSSITWTDTSEDHFHLVTGRTETTLSGGPYALTLTFTGSPVTSGAGSAHSHTGSSLTVSTTAEPLHMTLLPYYRL